MASEWVSRVWLMFCCVGSSCVDFGILIVYCMRWIHSCLRVCRIASIVLTVYSLTPETLHTLWGKETTHMNSRIIVIAGLGVPLSTGPSTISFYVFFIFILRWTDVLSMPVFSCMHIYVLLCVLIANLSSMEMFDVGSTLGASITHLSRTEVPWVGSTSGATVANVSNIA